MVLAIPAGMGQASKLRHSSSLYECYQASLEELCQTPAKGQTFSSRTGQTSGLPIELSFLLHADSNRNSERSPRSKTSRRAQITPRSFSIPIHVKTRLIKKTDAKFFRGK